MSIVYIGKFNSLKEKSDGHWVYRNITPRECVPAHGDLWNGYELGLSTLHKLW